MIEVSNLACTEAALTGESLPVEKVIEAIEASQPDQVPLGDRKNMAFSATLCSQGRGLGVVVAGQILALVEFPTQAGLGEVPTETVYELTYLYIPIVFFFYLIAMAVLILYNITREEHADNLRRLSAEG